MAWLRRDELPFALSADIRAYVRHELVQARGNGGGQPSIMCDPDDVLRLTTLVRESGLQYTGAARLLLARREGRV